jgi:hypothetical protein
MNQKLKSKIFFWFTIIASWASILGLACTIIPLLNSERQPYFLTDPNKITILSNSNLKKANIKIFKPDGSEIKSNLYLLKFYFWNQGKKTINSKDILEKINISLNSKSVEIVDYRIISFSRKICGIKINKTNLNTLSLNFDLLERNDGFSGQIIYEGSPNVDLNMSGTILETKILKGIYSGENSSESRGAMQVIVLFLLLGVALIACLTLSILTYYFLCIPFYKYLSSKSTVIDNFIKSTEITNFTRDYSVIIICLIFWFLIGLPSKKIVPATVNYLTGVPDIPEDINPMKVR